MPIVFLTEPSRTIGSSFVPESKVETPMTKLDVYLSSMPPMQRGKVRKALEKLQGFSGHIYKRHVYAERIAEDPDVSVDFENNRVILDNRGVFYSISQVTKAFAEYLDWLKNQDN